MTTHAVVSPENKSEAITAEETPSPEVKSLWSYAKRLFADNKFLSGFIVFFTLVVLAAGVTKFIVESLGQSLWTEHSQYHPWIAWIVATWLHETTAVDLFCAWLGLFVGIIVTLVVERAADRKDRRMRDATSRIDEATTRIGGATKDIGSATVDIQKQVQLITKALSLRAVSDYGTLLNEIEEIIKHARNTSNNLYVMNPTASFGYFVTFDVDVVLKHAGQISTKDQRKDVLSRLRGAEYFYYREELVKRHKSIQTELLNAGAAIRTHQGCQAQYVTLYADGEKSAYSEQFARPALCDSPGISRCVVISNMTQEPHEALELPAAAVESKKLFLVPEQLLQEDGSIDTEGPPLDKLVLHLSNDQRKKIKKLQNHAIKVTSLDRIPVQLFISWNEDGRECKSLVIFSNRYTIGETSELAAFLTEDQNVVATFVKMFQAIVRQETEEEGAPAPQISVAKA